MGLQEPELKEGAAYTSAPFIFVCNLNLSDLA